MTLHSSVIPCWLSFRHTERGTWQWRTLTPEGHTQSPGLLGRQESCSLLPPPPALSVPLTGKPLFSHTHTFLPLSAHIHFPRNSLLPVIALPEGRPQCKIPMKGNQDSGDCRSGPDLLSLTYILSFCFIHCVERVRLGLVEAFF